MSVNASNYRWQGSRATSDDFQDGEDNATSISAGSTPSEIMYAEIGDDNGVSSQFASYRVVRPGGSTGGNPRSQKGKFFADFQDSGGAATTDSTQVRLVKRPLNGDSRTILTRWFTIRALEEGDVEDRVVLNPTTDKKGNPLAIKDGDVLALEARNPSSSFEIARSNTTLEFPVQVGY